MSETLLYEQLTARELEVLRLIAAGLSNQDIAGRLVVARSTVKWHARQIYNKMGVDNRRQAVARARTAGLLSDTRPVRHNLPAQITPFIGRQTELTDLARLLRDPNLRLVTIIGPGGMGKTRLALAVAEHQMPHFTHGVCFVPLAPLTDPANLVMTIAEHSGYQLQADQREPRQQLLDFFREKRLLLVLDNFEHLLKSAPLVTDLLEAAPGVKALATSREVLGLYGETTYSLGRMPLTTSDDDALRLFAESARRVLPDFALDDANLPVATLICQRVGGLPLGIELAAAWLRTLTLADIADELGQGIDILDARPRSLRVVFDRSWRLMTDRQRQAFVGMSVFRGGCARLPKG
jgi:predicted ATPase/DNA-binding CsgD family transcriptional regulator